MESPAIEIDEVRLLFQGEGMETPRAELITRRAFEILEEMVEMDMKGVTRQYAIESLTVPAIEISFAHLPDETIANTTAETLFRALLNVI